MKRTFVLLLSVFMVSCVYSQDTTIKTKPGVMVKVDSKTGADVKWVNVHKKTLQMLESKDGWAAACSTTPGEYVIAWYACKDGKSTEPNYVTIVVSGDAVPDTLDLVKTLKEAYSQDTDADKAKLLSTLAELYKEGNTAVDSTQVKTWGQLFTVMSTAAKTLGVSGKLPKTQAAVGVYLKSQLSTKADETLTDDGRKKAKAAFTAVSSALEEVGK